MPMTADGLSSAIQAAIIAELGAPDNAAQLTKFCDAIGMAVVTYIQANALVDGEVTSGAGAGGTVTGTIE